jgi:flagellar protein FliO/FliZ
MACCGVAALSVLAPIGAACAQQTGSAVLDGDAMLLRTVLALMFVIALILGAAWLARRFGLISRATGELPLRVVASCALGTRERVVVLEVEKTWLVLGVTAHNITPLHTLPANAQPPVTGAGTTPAARALEKLWRRNPTPPAPGTGSG